MILYIIAKTQNKPKHQYLIGKNMKDLYIERKDQYEIKRLTYDNFMILIYREDNNTYTIYTIDTSRDNIIIEIINTKNSDSVDIFTKLTKKYIKI